MKDQEMRIAIAEACGWRKTSPDTFAVVNPWQSPTGGYHTYCPDYPKDLNACHEMELSLSLNQFDRYEHYLREACYGTNNDVKGWVGRDVILATARQRCESFLRTLNLWTETPERKTDK